MSAPRRIVLVQLPIPQLGVEPARGNVPLAAGYLHLFARHRGLESSWAIEILPPNLSNRLSDRGLVDAILSREPWMVGFTCYLWNVERSLWVAEQLKRRRPELRVLVGGPEITADNRWVLECPQVDFAALGEGEQTFAELLGALVENDLPLSPIPGLYVSPFAAATVAADASVGHDPRRGAPPLPRAGRHRSAPVGRATSARSTVSPGAPPHVGALPVPRSPLPDLDVISSPYLAGILDASEERMLLLETLRGCVFRCKFCYYPKSYDDLYFLSKDRIVENLRHACERGVREVILLDPTLNQRRDFPEFLRLLAACNPDHAFTYFGELRAEGVGAEIARLLRDANFTEVEIGLQSVDPVAGEIMDRRNNLRAFERGVGAMLEAGLRVKVDLIVGLPGDTPESVRRGIHWVRESGLYTDVQVFNLAVLPGTSFREEAVRHGLLYQPRPPYHVLGTPTMDFEDICSLVAEAEDTFDTEFDALPPPRLDPGPLSGDPPRLARAWCVDFDREQRDPPPPAAMRACGFTLWLRGQDLASRAEECTRLVRLLLDDNPHTTLQVVLEPTGEPHLVTPDFLETLLEACCRVPTYLDRFFAIAPGVVKGTKRLVVLVPAEDRDRVGAAWVGAVGECATLVWRGALDAADLDAHEFVLHA